MSDLPVSLPVELEPAFVAALDPAGKIVAALDALGPITDRDVVAIDAGGGPIVAGLDALGARLSSVALERPFRINSADHAADAVVSLWSAFRGVDPAEIAEVDRVLRPGGRQLVVHDYGRDDVSRLYGDRPEYGSWSHRTGPFLTGGFKLRVLHCFWEFASQEAATAFLATAYGEPGEVLAATLKRPRLSWNVAVYHRSRS